MRHRRYGWLHLSTMFCIVGCPWCISSNLLCVSFVNQGISTRGTGFSSLSEVSYNKKMIDSQKMYFSSTTSCKSLLLVFHSVPSVSLNFSKGGHIMMYRRCLDPMESIMVEHCCIHNHSTVLSRHLQEELTSVLVVIIPTRRLLSSKIRQLAFWIVRVAITNDL